MFNEEHPIEAQVYLASSRSAVHSASDYASSEELSMGDCSSSEEDCSGGKWPVMRVASAAERRRKSLRRTVADAEFFRFLWDHCNYGAMNYDRFGGEYCEYFLDKGHKLNRFSEAVHRIEQEEEMQERALSVSRVAVGCSACPLNLGRLGQTRRPG